MRIVMKQFCSYAISQAGIKSSQEILNDLATSLQGISRQEAEERLKTCGPNAVTKKEYGLVTIFIRQLKNSFVYLLSAASFFSLLIGELGNGLILLFFVAFDVLLSFYQEAKSYRTLLLLKKELPRVVTVIRDNRQLDIHQTLLVPGDIVLLKAGMIVPADIRVLQAQNMVADESILTGESIQVAKSAEPLKKQVQELNEMGNMVFAGTVLMSGIGLGVVIAIGENSQLGSIEGLIAKIKPESSYEQNITKLFKMLAHIALITVPTIVIIQAIINPTTHILGLITFAIALIVGILPEAFPAVMAFSLARGALLLAKHDIIVRRLTAIEDLGDIDILCVDKTGTLTESKLVLQKVVASDQDTIVLWGLLSAATDDSKAGFDVAITSYASEKVKEKTKSFRRLAEIPFDSERIRNSELVEDEKGERILIVRGAPEVLLNISSQTEQPRDELEKQFVEVGEEGGRILGIAIKKITQESITKDDETDLTFVGFFIFFDPIKKTVKATLKRAESFGVAIKVLTGDAKEVAFFVAKEVGLLQSAAELITGAELNELSEAEFENACLKYTVFARINPSIKFRIVKSLQKNHDVGFLGNGVNDAPALKTANVGIAVKEAVDVARESADVVLLRKDLSVLIDGIEQGRKIFANINTYVKTTISSNIGNHYSLGFFALLLPFLPLLPIQILLVNLLSDLPLLTIVTDNVLPTNLKEPKRYQLNKGLLYMFLLASISIIPDIILFALYRRLPERRFQSLFFILGILTEVALVFVVRTHTFFLRKPYPSVPLLLASVLVAMMAIAIPYSRLGNYLFAFVPPLPSEVITIIGLVFVYIGMSETMKLIYFRIEKT